MSRSISSPDLPLHRETEPCQDFDNPPDEDFRSRWGRLLAIVPAILKRLGLLSREAREEARGLALFVLPPSTEHGETAMIDDIHELVAATFSNLGMPAPVSVCKTLVVRDGCFVGRKFHCDGGYAIWGAGWETVEFYGAGGKLLKIVSLKETLRRNRTRKSAA